MSKQGKKNILFLIIIFALGLYILYDKDFFLSQEKTQISNKKDSKSLEMVLEEDVSKESKNKTDFKEEQIDSCEAEILKETIDKNIKYVKKSVLVSFVSGVDFETAKEIISKYDLKIQDESFARIRFESDHRWFSVLTKESGEFKAVCDLKLEEKVKNAILEPLFEIHE